MRKIVCVIGHFVCAIDHCFCYPLDVARDAQLIYCSVDRKVATPASTHRDELPRHGSSTSVNSCSLAVAMYSGAEMQLPADAAASASRAGTHARVSGGSSTYRHHAPHTTHNTPTKPSAPQRGGAQPHNARAHCTARTSSRAPDSQGPSAPPSKLAPCSARPAMVTGSGAPRRLLPKPDVNCTHTATRTHTATHSTATNSTTRG